MTEYRYWIYAWDNYYPSVENVVGRYSDVDEAIGIAKTKTEIFQNVVVIDALPMFECGACFDECPKLYYSK